MNLGGDGAVDPDDPDIAAAPPNLLPCPDGWIELPGEVTTCAPWQPKPDEQPSDIDTVELQPFAGSGMASCAAGETHLPGTSACAPVGSPCPTGTFSDALPTGTIIYAIASQGGGPADGTEAKPYHSIGDALVNAPDGATLALSGSFDEDVVLDRSLTLWGRCASDTHIGSLTISGAQTKVNIHNLSLWSASVTSSATAMLDGIVLETDDSSTSGAIHCDGATMTVRRAKHVQSIAPFESGITPYASIRAENGCLLHVEDSSMIGASEGAAVASGADTAVTIERSVFGRTYATRSVTFCATGAEQTRCTEAPRAGESCTTPWCSPQSGTATLSATGGASIIGDAVVLRGYYVNALATGGQSTIELTRSSLGRVIELAHCSETSTVVLPARGYNAIARNGGTVRIASSVIAESSAAAVLGFYGELDLDDVVIHNTLSRSEYGDSGRAVELQAGAAATLDRVLIEANRDVGIYARGSSAYVSGRDIHVTDTRTQLCVDGSDCPDCAWDATSSIAAHSGALIELQRFVLDHSALIGVQQSSGGLIQLHDGVVSNNPIAANIQDPDYDLRTLQDNVLWLDNTTELDAEQLAVPEPERDLGEL